MGSRFTYKITKLPGYAVTMYQDGVFQRELSHYYADSAEQAGIDWVFDREQALRASMDIHPAGQQAPSGRHARLVEDAA